MCTTTEVSKREAAALPHLLHRLRHGCAEQQRLAVAGQEAYSEDRGRTSQVDRWLASQRDWNRGAGGNRQDAWAAAASMSHSLSTRSMAGTEAHTTAAEQTHFDA